MFRTVIIVSLASAALSGCAQDSTDPATNDRWGQVDIPPSTQLNQLTADQRAELCEVNRQIIPPDFECRLESTASQSSTAACERARAACVEEQGPIAEPDCAAATAEPIDCDAPFELLQACLDEQLIAIPRAFGALTCENAEAVHFGEMIEATLSLKRMTPSCQRLEARCPSLSGSDDT